jgi:hypothetical protein
LIAPDFSQGITAIGVSCKQESRFLQALHQAHDLFEIAHLGCIQGQHFFSPIELQMALAASTAVKIQTYVHLRIKSSAICWRAYVIIDRHLARAPNAQDSQMFGAP